MTLALTIPESGALTAKQMLEGLNAVRAAIAPDLNDEELRLFAMVAKRSGLDPFAKQVYAVKRKGRATFQTGIDGYRSIAERTGEYDGSDEPEYGPWIDKPFGHPEWAQVTVYRIRNGRRLPQSATAWWDEFDPGEGPMWRKMPRNQLAKCAEALAFRKAFPYVFADIYTTEEMAQADSRDASESKAQAVAALPTVRERVAARRAGPPPAAPEPEPEPEADDAEDADIVDVPADWQPEAPQPAQDALCGSQSPYGDNSTCALKAGHPKNHKSTEGTWA